MATLAQLFEFASQKSGRTIKCSLIVTTNSPEANPPPEYVLNSMGKQQPNVALSVTLDGRVTTVTFPQVTVYSEGFTPPSTGMAYPPGIGNYPVSITRNEFVIPTPRKVITHYAATFEFPWGQTLSCLLHEVEEGSIITGAADGTSIAMWIGTPWV
jgi:hypothetical protein